MPQIGPTELIIVLVIFILLFGAKKLPDLGSSVGKSIKNFKKGMKDGAVKEDEEGTPEAVTEPEPEVPPATQTARHDS